MELTNPKGEKVDVEDNEVKAKIMDAKIKMAQEHRAALREMIAPGVIAVTAPVVVGFFIGPAALGGMLLGSLLVGVVAGFLSPVGDGTPAEQIANATMQQNLARLRRHRRHVPAY